MLNLNRGLFLLACAACLVLPVPSALALIAGIIWACSVGNPLAASTKQQAPRLLQLGIVCIGAGMNLNEILAAGTNSFLYTLLVVSLTLGIGITLGLLVKTRRDTSLLLSTGTAICGGSAIAATAVTIRAKSTDISIALAIVFTLNAIALLIFPPLGHYLDLSQRQFGLWCALAIHDTSSVVGAAMGYGPEALAVATTTKLIRMLLIIPVALLLGAWTTRQALEERRGNFKLPWFIVGFLMVAAISTYLPAVQPYAAFVHQAGKRLLVLALFLIGSGLDPASLKTIGARPLVQGIVLWLLVVTGTLAGICSGWIS